MTGFYKVVTLAALLGCSMTSAKRWIPSPMALMREKRDPNLDRHIKELFRSLKEDDQDDSLNKEE